MEITKIRAFKAATLLSIAGVSADGFTSGNREGAVWQEKPVVYEAFDTFRVNKISNSDPGPVIGEVNSLKITDSSSLPRGSYYTDDYKNSFKETANPAEFSEIGDDTPTPPHPLTVPTNQTNRTEIYETSNEQVTGSETTSAGDLCYGTWFRPRGFNLYPNPDPQIVWYDAPGSGYEIRRLLGMECFGDNRNFIFDASDEFKKSSFNSTYGRRIVHSAGYVLEGCADIVEPHMGITGYQCDFKSSGDGPHKLNLQQSGAFWRQRLKNWANQTVQNQGSCATSIVGIWVGTQDLNDVAVNCIDNGPIQPGSL